MRSEPRHLWPLVANAIRAAVEGRHILAVGVPAQLGIDLVDDAGKAVSRVLLSADRTDRVAGVEVA
jgi:hypothetical protein